MAMYRVGPDTGYTPLCWAAPLEQYKEGKKETNSHTERKEEGNALQESIPACRNLSFCILCHSCNHTIGNQMRCLEFNSRTPSSCLHSTVKTNDTFHFGDLILEPKGSTKLGVRFASIHRYLRMQDIFFLCYEDTQYWVPRMLQCLAV